MPSARRGGAARRPSPLPQGLGAGCPPRGDARRAWLRTRAFGCACRTKARSQPLPPCGRSGRAWRSRRPWPHRRGKAGGARGRARAPAPSRWPRAPPARAPCVPSPVRAAVAGNGSASLPGAPTRRADARARAVPCRLPGKAASRLPPRRRTQAAPPQAPSPRASPNVSFLLPPI